MLTSRTSLIALALLAGVVASACSGASDPSPPPPTNVERAVSAIDAGVLRINVGLILNSAAPTAERDMRLAEVLEVATESLDTDVQVQIETVTIDATDDVESAVATLASRGVTVIATSCDDSSMSQVVETAIEEEFLAITGCVAIPRPELPAASPLLIDLARLGDAPDVMTKWMSLQGFDEVAVVSSELISDVTRTCSSLSASLDEANIGIAATATYTELLDDPTMVVSSISEPLGDADAIAICALPPAIADMVRSLRSAGFEQPIMVPWFGDDQNWPAGTNNVFVLATASRYGDDPADRVQGLFAELDSPAAVDVVAADMVAILAEAAQSSGSVGSQRLAETLVTEELDAATGPLTLNAGDAVASSRTYRLIEIVDGEAMFRDLIDIDGRVQFSQ